MSEIKNELRSEFDKPVTLPGTPTLYAVGVHIWQGETRVSGAYIPASSVAESRRLAEGYARDRGCVLAREESTVKAAILDGAGLLAFLVVLGLWLI